MANDETPPLFETSSKYTENPAITDEVYAAKRRAKRVVTKHGLPEGFNIYHMGTGIDRTGKIRSDTFHSHIYDSYGDERGGVSWDPRTGKIAGLSIPDKELRPFASHLLLAAHEYADKEGVTGPTHSDNLTDYSYNMAKKLVPSAMPKNAIVHGAPIAYRSNDFSGTLHTLKSRAHLLEAQAGQLHPSLAGWNNTSFHINEAIDAHSRSSHVELEMHLFDATATTHDLETKIHQLSDPNAGSILYSIDSLRDDLRNARIGRTSSNE